MKKLFIMAALWLLYGGTAFCQSKLNPDSTGITGRERVSSLQWSRSLKDGKAVYYLFDAQLGKTYPIYTAQFANYVLLGKDEAQSMYQTILSGNGVPYINAGAISYLQTTTGGIGSTIVTRDANGKSTFKDLDVAGVVHAKEILVDQNVFPDYVFNSDYKLKNLADVKTYIDKNHHLPDMPSEKEVTSNGLKVGEVTNILTKKVEELTLYLIKQQELIKTLRVEISSKKSAKLKQ